MQIEILHLIEGAKRATGLTVIIDVFRAFSTACYVFNNGATRIIPVAELDLAYALKQQHPEYILMGEREGKKPAGFDYGNSPADIEKVDFTAKTVIQTTSAGTQGIINARQADEIITGSFVNAQAVANYIRLQNPTHLSLVCMGHQGINPTDEDSLCANYIKNLLETRKNNFREIIDYLKTYDSAQKFFDPAIDWAPARDFDLCLNLNRFNFILRASADNNDLISLNKKSVQVEI